MNAFSFADLDKKNRKNKARTSKSIMNVFLIIQVQKVCQIWHKRKSDRVVSLWTDPWMFSASFPIFLKWKLPLVCSFYELAIKYLNHSYVWASEFYKTTFAGNTNIFWWRFSSTKVDCQRFLPGRSWLV